MNVAIIGGNGLIGGLLSRRFSQCGVAINLLVRRNIKLDSLSIRQHVAPPERWPEIVKNIKPDIAISALGTTIKQAGSQSAFEAVDFDIVTAFAAGARKSGARQMIVVSSVGANADASNFYLRTKGRMELALRDMAFDRLNIVRPGLLLGKRDGPARTGESIAAAFSPIINFILRGPLDRYGAIDADIVAAAIVTMTAETTPGVFVHENRALKNMAHGSGLDVSGA